MPQRYWLAWALAFPAGGRKIIDLQDRFGSLQDAWFTGGSDPRFQGIEAAVARRGEVNIERELERLHRYGIKYVTWEDQHFPVPLRHIPDPPAVIFYMGALPVDSQYLVAVVGARRCTNYGRELAFSLAENLAANGIVVVSGMARGVDSAAHRGAIGGGGTTVAVLGTGLDVPYPRENSKLMHEMAERGAVISEFGLGTQPQAWHFPVRNRIIAGLSRGVIVVEAPLRSGALITADLALEYNRDVMAVPGPVTSTQSRGCHRLIKQGARLVEDAGDVLDELGLTVLYPATEARAATTALAPEEETLLSLFREEGGPLGEDALIERSGLDPARLIASLAFLEIKGLVTRLPGRVYSISHRHRE